MKALTHKHRGLRIHLGDDRPATVAPMKIKLYASKKPVKGKVRIYPTEKQKVLHSHFG